MLAPAPVSISTNNAPEITSLDLLWGCRAIAAFIGKPPSATMHLLEQGKLPVTKVGRQWVASKSRLGAHFNAQLVAAE